MAIDGADLADAVDDGFRQDTAEKVRRLLDVLREIQARRATKDRFTLKGGTALNIFHLPDVPRLSVDIDLITTGYPKADEGSNDRKEAKAAILSIVHDQGYKSAVKDSEDSGITVHCNYRNLSGTNDKIKIDLDFVGRQTLLETVSLAGPKLFDASDLKFPNLAKAELQAQKLVAVAYRGHPRDLYDMHRMIRAGWPKAVRGPQLYRAQSLLKDYDWYRLAYPTKLDFTYTPSLLQDVLREADSAPSLDELREEAKAALHPAYTVASDADQAERKRLLDGDRTALARIAGEPDAARAKLLAESPALAWRLEVARRAKAKR